MSVSANDNSSVITTAGLIVTYSCNLNCTYCYENNKADRYMTFETAREILTPLLKESAEPLQVMLMGGEPLMAFPVIRQLVEWVLENKNQWNRDCFFFGSTNGTLLDGERKQWFHLHRDHVILALSFDGLPEAQNRNRCCSAKRIDLEFFQQNWPNQKIQMTINEDTVDQMAAGVIFLLKNGFQVNPSVAYENH